MSSVVFSVFEMIKCICRFGVMTLEVTSVLQAAGEVEKKSLVTFMVLEEK